MTFDSKTYEILVNASISVNGFGGISFHVMAENWQHMKYTLAFRHFLCVRIEIDSCLQSFVAQYITGCQSIVHEYITRASR